ARMRGPYSFPGHTMRIPMHMRRGLVCALLTLSAAAAGLAQMPEGFSPPSHGFIRVDASLFNMVSPSSVYTNFDAGPGIGIVLDTWQNNPLGQERSGFGLSVQ